MTDPLFLMALLCFLAGACIFSFLNVVVWRLPRGESPLGGRSRCPACGRELTAWELVPCVSFLVLRGKCRDCGAKIPGRDFWVEALGGVLLIGCAVKFGPGTVRSGLTFVLLSLLTVVGLMDWDTMEIYDRFQVAILLCALAAVVVFPEVSLLDRLIGALCVSLPMLVVALVIPGGFGGGDIKLMFALGAFLGWRHTLLTGFFALFGGGIYAIYLLKQGKAGRKDHFAFGPFLCASAGFAIFWGDSILNWYLAFW